MRNWGNLWATCNLTNTNYSYKVNESYGDKPLIVLMAAAEKGLRTSTKVEDVLLRSIESQFIA